jgi:hypothetical protein
VSAKVGHGEKNDEQRECYLAFVARQHAPIKVKSEIIPTDRKVKVMKKRKGMVEGKKNGLGFGAPVICSSP